MTDDVLATIVGTPTGKAVVTVERGHVAAFADAVKDDSAAYRDPSAAAALGLPGIPAPPTYPFVMENFGRFPELQPADGGSQVGAAIAPLLAGAASSSTASRRSAITGPCLPATCWRGTARWSTRTARSPKEGP